MKTRYRWLCGSILALLLLAAVGYAALRIWRAGRSEANSVSAQASFASPAHRFSASLPPAEDEEVPGDPVLYAGPQPSAEQLRAATKGANLIICVLDGARYDHLGCSGYPRDTSPNIDRLAGHSLLFTQHFCQIPHTIPSTASLLTSQYPETHGLLGRFHPLESPVFSMESGLNAAGWHTAMFTSNVHASPDMGVGLGFDAVIRAWQSPGQANSAVAFTPKGEPELLLSYFSAWLGRQHSQPFFAYIHFRPPHVPYDAPKHIRDEFNAANSSEPHDGGSAATSETGDAGRTETDRRNKIDLYDVNMRYADWAYGELEKLLRQHGVFDSTLLILTADHGETLGQRDHGTGMRELMWRQYCLYDEAIHIPLVVKLPGESGPVGEVFALTQTIDLLPTIFDLFAIPYPQERVQGRSLVPLLTGEIAQANKYVFVRTSKNPDLPDKKVERKPESYLVRSLTRALILHQGGEVRELYDLKADPGQTRNIIGERPQQAERLIQAFSDFALTQAMPPLDFLDPRYEPPPAPETPALEMTDEVREQLRALGYLK